MNEREDAYCTAAQVRARYGNVSDMSLYRWVRNPSLGFHRLSTSMGGDTGG